MRILIGLFLKDLLKKSEDEHTKEDLAAGIAAAERVLMKANSAVDKNILEEALQDLIHRVDDWKSHKVDNFGSLLLHGVYTVITGKSEQEKDVRISPWRLRSSFLLVQDELIMDR